jgi:hypothetical protein
MGLQWDGSNYNLVLLPPGCEITDPPNLPACAITEDNYWEPDYAEYDIEFFNGYNGQGSFNKPFKFFKVNNPLAGGVGAWKYAIEEIVPPTEGEEPLRVYMSKESDLVLDFFTDQERYYLYDENNNPVDVEVLFTAILTRGGGLDDDEHTQTEGEKINDALVKILVSAPDGQKVAGQLDWIGDGEYTIKLKTDLVGNYDVVVIASDYDPNNPNYNNSEYLITSEHSFYVAPFKEAKEYSGKYYIELALQELLYIMDTYCLNPPQDCELDNNTKRDINNAITLLTDALEYFVTVPEDDDNRLKTNKGLTFYDKVTTAVNKIYSYIEEPLFGNNVDNALGYLIEGSWKIANLALRDAQEPGACVVSNCEEILNSASAEIGKALEESKQNNYVYIFNHLTNAWKFAQNAMGANLRKQSGEEDNDLIPTEYGLDQNYPNPFNPSTEIRYQLPENNHVKLQVYDILGNVVETLLDNEIEAGYHSIQWNAGRFASGVYFYRIVSGSFVSTKKLMLMK